MIICDTREKKNDHIIRFFEDSNISFEISKIDTGDYLNTDFPTLRVDRKQNLDEVLQNLASSDKSRFWRELRRSKDEKLTLFFLIEHSRNINSLPDVANWRSYWSKVSGAELAQRMWEVECAYGVKFEFCDKKHTASKILELLRYDTR